jgi:dolichol-phosphate mannosyltransferase
MAPTEATEPIRNTHVENLFVIERGEPQLRDVGFEETIETLLENTDDAYGFPPFRQMAPSIVIGNDDYAELRRRERLLLIQAMSAIRVRRLASNTFSWADDIASVLGTRISEPAARELSRVASASS